jgi:hypothetical protein
MKVFISWSGDRSRAVAELLKVWVKCVLQASQPWISTRDIDRGAVWFSEISQQLNDTAVGIVCLTQENKLRPWILFEAGALAKGLSNRVCTLLVDLTPRDLEQPLASFNATLPTREGMFGLAQTLNACLGSMALEPIVLERAFEAYWTRFEADFAAALAATPPAEPVAARKQDDVLSEILGNTRDLAHRVASLERLSTTAVAQEATAVEMTKKALKARAQDSALISLEELNRLLLSGGRVEIPPKLSGRKASS